MDATKEARLDRIKNRPTKYELVATNGVRRVLVCYAHRTGRRGLWDAICSSESRCKAVIALTGEENISFAKRAADGAVMGGWTIRFSGRTQRDAIMTNSELPYVEDYKGE